MITRKHLAAMLGFAFVAAWIGLGFGEAILCLLGAAIFYAAVSFLDGDLDLVDLQGRLGAVRAPAQTPVSPPTVPAPPPRPRPRPRVR